MSANICPKNLNLLDSKDENHRVKVGKLAHKKFQHRTAIYKLFSLLQNVCINNFFFTFHKSIYIYIYQILNFPCRKKTTNNITKITKHFIWTVEFFCVNILLRLLCLPLIKMLLVSLWFLRFSSFSHFFWKLIFLHICNSKMTRCQWVLFKWKLNGKYSLFSIFKKLIVINSSKKYHAIYISLLPYLSISQKKTIKYTK